MPIRLLIGFGFLVHGLAKLNRGPEKFATLLALIGTPFPLPTAWMVTTLEGLRSESSLHRRTARAVSVRRERTLGRRVVATPRS
ncbi:MAG: hypothetical protein ACJ79A_20955 [Gemmatimonadaceae bacterium]